MNAKSSNRNQDQRIILGDIITLPIETPNINPLLSFDLLYMQYILHKLVPISGSADMTDKKLADKDEGSILEGSISSFGIMQCASIPIKGTFRIPYPIEPKTRIQNPNPPF